jgi:hypothetical protein
MIYIPHYKGQYCLFQDAQKVSSDRRRKVQLSRRVLSTFSASKILHDLGSKRLTNPSKDDNNKGCV